MKIKRIHFSIHSSKIYSIHLALAHACALLWPPSPKIVVFMFFHKYLSNSSCEAIMKKIQQIFIGWKLALSFRILPDEVSLYLRGDILFSNRIESILSYWCLGFCYLQMFTVFPLINAWLKSHYKYPVSLHMWKSSQTWNHNEAKTNSTKFLFHKLLTSLFALQLKFPLMKALAVLWPLLGECNDEIKPLVWDLNVLSFTVRCLAISFHHLRVTPQRKVCVWMTLMHKDLNLAH